MIDEGSIIELLGVGSKNRKLDAGSTIELLLVVIEVGVGSITELLVVVVGVVQSTMKLIDVGSMINVVIVVSFIILFSVSAVVVEKCIGSTAAIATNHYTRVSL